LHYKVFYRILYPVVFYQHNYREYEKPYLVEKGSICIDGVSLTLVHVKKDKFSVSLIPHTLSVTTLAFRKIGDLVNVETDMMAKYAMRSFQLFFKGKSKSE